LQFSAMGPSIGSSGRLSNTVKKRSDSQTRDHNKLPNIRQSGMMSIERLSNKENTSQSTN